GVVSELHSHGEENRRGQNNFSGNCRKGITLTNVRNVRLADLNLTGYQGQFLSTNNVTTTR
ncbi:MAG TPA: hypothetical protein VK327_13920, partial [Candidatus Paceibacterota bacterium]|nr:hypothetical protein [Candidatus Paceibacterota bacterium]